MQASTYGHTAVVSALLDKGASVQAADKVSPWARAE
jgi:hypothetical protein